MDDYFDGRGGKLGLRAAPTSVLGRALERVPRGAPAAATASGTVNLAVTVNGEAATIAVPVVPPMTGRIAITVDPPVLSATSSATIRIQPPPGAVAMEGRTFKVTAFGVIGTAGGWFWIRHAWPGVAILVGGALLLALAAAVRLFFLPPLAIPKPRPAPETCAEIP